MRRLPINVVGILKDSAPDRVDEVEVGIERVADFADGGLVAGVQGYEGPFDGCRVNVLVLAPPACVGLVVESIEAGDERLTLLFPEIGRLRAAYLQGGADGRAGAWIRDDRIEQRHHLRGRNVAAALDDFRAVRGQHYGRWP